MQLNLRRPIVFFDLETTGLSLNHDKIVELSYIKVYPDGKEEERTYRFNPGMHIPEEAQEVHHISDEDVANAPTFKSCAKELVKVFRGCDIAGFNSNRFDVPMLVEELFNAGEPLDYKNCRFVDVQTIFHKMEQRTLVAAYKFYCGKELEGAHGAMNDTRATYEVLKAQLDRYDTLENDVEFLSEFSSQKKNVDLAGRLIYNAAGEIVVNFGKHKGRTLKEVFNTDFGYYDWVMHSDFSQDTKRIFTMVKLGQL